jgi:hypothetical protein
MTSENAPGKSPKVATPQRGELATPELACIPANNAEICGD